MTDVRGALAIGHDEGTWLTVLYEATQVAAMAFAPWCSVTFSLRRFTLFAIGGFALLALLCPFAPNLESLLVLRTLQGLMAGCLPPMLMTVALRFLPPGIKLYGLGAYALTATFGPNLGLPLAAFWFEYVGWQWVFWQVIPLCLVAMAAVSHGIPQDPVRLERFRQFDGIGLLTGFPAICALVIGLLQGERLDWFESPLICLLLGSGSLLLGLFLVNEWSHPLPFFRLQLLKRRNLTFALITLAGVLVVLGASMGVPTEFLAEIRGYRPPAERTHGVAGGPSAARRAAAGGGPLQHPAGRLPLGAGLRPVPVRRCLPELQPTDGGLGARGLLPADAVTGGRPADGGDSAADALHQRHRAHRGTLRLGLVQHRPRLLRGSRHRGDRRPRHRPRALPLQPPGGSPGQCAPGRRTAPATDRRPATGRRLRRALAAPGRTGPPTGPGAGQRRRAAGNGRPGLRPADPDSDPAATGLPAPPGRSHTLKGRCMSFITSRKGSLLLAALLVLTLLVYLLFHLLAPRVVQSTDDAYVHADFTLVAPKVAGFVQDVLVEDNQPVKAGQLLARLDDRDFRTALAAAEADVLGAEANLANAEANLQRQQALIEQARAKVRAEQAELVFARHEQSRYQTLASKGAGSLQNAQQAQSRIDTASARLAEGQAAVDATRKQVSVLEARVGQARGDLQRMQARRDQARLDLSYCELRAPFDGQVGRRQLRVGAYVTPGSALLAVVPLQQAYVVGNFQETQLTHVSPGQAVEIRVDTFPGEVLRGHVDSIAPATGLSFAPIAPDNATGNFTKVVQRIPVKIVLEPRQAMAGKLRVGMSVEARIDTATGTRSAEVAQQ
ncbi:MFS transporter [Pseudomonas aeruginosa]|uniref:MFS transporter n=1 Tax=Pseudomonas aeruginosa TaxID=287 RepID=UPI003458E347